MLNVSVTPGIPWLKHLFVEERAEPPCPAKLLESVLHPLRYPNLQGVQQRLLLESAVARGPVVGVHIARPIRPHSERYGVRRTVGFGDDPLRPGAPYRDLLGANPPGQQGETALGKVHGSSS